MNHILEKTKCLSEEEIKKYFSDKATKVEIRRVENHLLDCALCALAMEGFEAHYDFTADDDLDSLKDFPHKQSFSVATSKVLQEEQAPIVSLSSRSRLYFINRVAAAILLLLLPAATWLYLNNQKDAALSTGFETIEMDITRGFGDDNVFTEYEAMVYKATAQYNVGNYEVSLQVAEDWLAQYKEDTKAALLAGMAALKMEDYSLAESYLTTVRINDTESYEQATWLLAHVYLHIQDKKKAIALLDELIALGDGRFFRKAKEMKQDL